MDGTQGIELALEGVAETLLWPLWHKACEAKRSDRLIDDPLAVQLVERIDYDFEGNFGTPKRLFPVRYRFGDERLHDFLQRHKEKASVVALGEGLETQYWRLGEPPVPWFSVDQPEVMVLRERLLPRGKTVTQLSCSALDQAWMDQIPEGSVPFISAMGLFMYFEEADVVRLLTAIAARFPGAELYFDAIPAAFSKKTLRGYQVTKAYRAPPMPWGISTDALSGFLRSIPGLDPISVRTYAEPFPSLFRFFYALSKIGPIRRRLAPSLVHAKVVAAT
ncbi:MAG: class I SAM-dependent methyltransferase [Pseudomonadota bacterium]